ncbi:MAG: DUF1071 domain-containing protein [Prevotella sp.]|nr:DUF1071 domain-containing protein [Candidatus Prevotella equi]
MEKENEILRIFKELNSGNVSKDTKQKDTGVAKLNYLPWAKAWEKLCMIVPDATYEIVKNENNLPYFASELGIMVYTNVTIAGVTRQMWLSVMDSSNRALRTTPYTVKKKKKDGTTYDVEVPAATMNDINKTLMRCLTKNIAMFGLGLHVYEGEDITSVEKEALEEEAYVRGLETLLGFISKAKDAKELQYYYDNNNAYLKDEQFIDAMNYRLKKLIADCTTFKSLGQVYAESRWAQTNPEFIEWCSTRKVELQQDSAA